MDEVKAADGATGGAIRVRAARVDDVAAIFRIRTAVRENHLDRGALAALGITEEAVAGMIAGGLCTWVAFDGKNGDHSDGGGIAGFAMVDAEEGVLFALFVLPEAEGRGLGRALLAAAEARLFADHARIRLETAAGTRAAGFYRRHGWVEAAEIAGQGPATGDIRLEKSRAA